MYVKPHVCCGYLTMDAWMNKDFYKAVDGRGLDEATRSNYCKEMLQWILQDWMPHLDSGQHDYSLVDVNR